MVRDSERQSTNHSFRKKVLLANLFSFSGDDRSPATITSSTAAQGGLVHRLLLLYRPPLDTIDTDCQIPYILFLGNGILVNGNTRRSRIPHATAAAPAAGTRGFSIYPTFACIPRSYVRRAYAAHKNSFESMILWSSSVLLAKATGVSVDRMNLSAGIWLAARVV